MTTSGQSNQSNGMELSPVEGRNSRPLALGGDDDAYDQVQVVITDGSYDRDQDDTISFTLNGEGATFCSTDLSSTDLTQISVKVEAVNSNLGVWGVQKSAPKFQSTSATHVTVNAEMTSRRNSSLTYTGSYAFTFTRAAASFPVASTSAAGIVQLASRAEVTKGADATKAVTPSDIHAVYAPLDNPQITGTVNITNDQTQQKPADQELVTAKWVQSQWKETESPTTRRCLQEYFLAEKLPSYHNWYRIPANSGDIITVLAEDNPATSYVGSSVSDKMISIKLGTLLKVGDYVWMTNQTQYDTRLMSGGPNGPTDQNKSTVQPGETWMFVVSADVTKVPSGTVTVQGYKIR